MLGTLPDPETTAMNKKNEFLALVKLTFKWGDKKKKASKQLGILPAA